MRITPIVAAASAAVLVAGGAAVAAPQPDTRTGPSSSQSPYLVPTAPHASTTSLLTVGDSVGDYRMVGIPDGLGAFDNGDGTFTVLMNHELRPDRGSVRDHGATGAFVSKWTINKKSLKVLAGDDLVKQVQLATGTDSWAPSAYAFNRLCSADLPDQSALYDKKSGLGTRNKIFFSGEEAGAEGRAFGHVVTGPDAGKSFELPALGNMSFENIVLQPGSGTKTVAVVTDDSTPGEIYVYVGTKQSTGNDVQRAGLTNGTLYGVKVAGVGAETDATSIPKKGVRFSLAEIPGAAAMTGAELQAASDTRGATKFARPEDASWDPTDASRFYAVTTASFTGISRLWDFDFDRAGNPVAGGTATTPIEGPPADPSRPSEQQPGPRMMDNITVNDDGQVLIQEDPGGQEYLAGIWLFDPKGHKGQHKGHRKDANGYGNGVLRRVFIHDPDRFRTGGSRFITIDEESSGIIPLPFLGDGFYLADVQAHRAHPDPELVEYGQLGILKLKGKGNDKRTSKK